MATENSGLREAVTTRINGLRRALETSRLVTSAETVTDRTATFVRNSWLYGWLTAEPEPEVIVIDLRETYTVGPFIAALDRIIETVAPWYRTSALKRGVDGVFGLGEHAAETRPGRFLVALLEPPEPPEEQNEPQNDPRTEE